MKKDIWKEFVEFPEPWLDSKKHKQDTTTIEKIIQENQQLRSETRQLQGDYFSLLEKYDRLVNNHLKATESDF